jgi:hypothetical protein
VGFADLEWYQAAGATIDALYREELHRPAEWAGSVNWLFHAREHGWTADEIRAAIRTSPEWHAVHDKPARPAPVPQAPLPPFDASDGFGDVHTVPPPELVIPSGPDLMFLRADFAGVRVGGTPPFLVGANSTPLDMLMTPMAPMYPREWQDRILTAHAERGYTHFVVASQGWNMQPSGDNAGNNFAWTPAQFVEWCRYVQSWGFYVVYWAPADVDAYLTAAVDAHAIDWLILGKEVDTTVRIAETYHAQLDAALAVVGDLPVAAHFTANYPKGSPKSTFFDGRSMPGFDAYDGRVHLMWQAHQNDSAGKQAAMLYYARMRVNVGGTEGIGRLAPNSRVYAFETMATAQLYGTAGEAYGNLRSLELLYATRRDDRIRPMSGFGNGCRLPDGRAL